MGSRHASRIAFALVLLLTPPARGQDSVVAQENPPSASDQKEMLKLVRDLYKDDYARRGAEDRKALAAKLLKAGRETKDDSRARYVLLTEASDVASRIGDGRTCLKALDLLAEHFRIDAAKTKADALALLAKQARTPEAAEDVARGFLSAAQDAVRQEDFKLAKSLVSKAGRAARAAKNAGLTAQVRTESGKIESLRREHSSLAAARKKLEASPDDAAANHTVGRFLCLFKGDWKNGLPLLAKGSDAQHQAAAKEELATPTSPGDQARLGDWWWNLGDAQKKEIQTYYRSRAGYWYERASVGATGLAKMKIDQRLDQILASRPGFVNLLRLVDVKKDAVHGAWKQEAGALISEKIDCCRIEVPYTPPGEYDLSVTFSRVEGTNDVNVILSRGGRAVVCVLGGGNISFGLGRCNGVWTNSPQNPSVVSVPNAFSIGREYTALIQVRRDRIRVSVDGKLIFDYETDGSDLEMSGPWRLRDDSLLGLGSFRSVVAFKKFSIVEVTGTGKKTR